MRAMERIQRFNAEIISLMTIDLDYHNKWSAVKFVGIESALILCCLGFILWSIPLGMLGLIADEKEEE